MAKSFKVTLKKSLIGCTQAQRDAVRCLGLARRHQTVDVKDNPANRGQILKVQHMLDVEVVR
ncbi:MAG TPA: 50S ribosomal protein L30 [Pseudobdellovibrionaceae bacterium]|nr:50S ribosomal protein L30 [Pseudobdellovibrionaceae bacterium]